MRCSVPLMTGCLATRHCKCSQDDRFSRIYIVNKEDIACCMQAVTEWITDYCWA